MALKPNEQEFSRLAGEGYNLIPVYRELAADLETPISVFCKLAAESPRFLLESAEGPERVGRYSFIGIDPMWTMVARDGTTEVTGRLEGRFEGDPLRVLRDLMSRYRAAQVPGLPRFFGGAVGFFGYDLVRHLECLPGGPIRDMEVPDASFVACETVVIYDHLTREIKVVVNAEVNGDSGRAYVRAAERLEAVVRILEGPVNVPRMGADGELPVEMSLPPIPDRESFLAAVRRAKEYIFSGDIFQVVLSVRRAFPLRVPAFEVYRSLRTLNPSPYLFYLDFYDLQLVGSSPEMLVRVEDGRVETRPIAGTRPRGADGDEDAALERELLADAKERAEHVMLVDLGRNDVGRVAEPGSVRVSDLMRVERYSHVMHIVSDVRGRLREGRDCFDALAACFPAGTLTGAPKVRAMEIIDELEPVRRGPYGGTVGYFGFSGNMDTCITIRTVVAHGGRAYIQAGAGIVADSDPEREWAECENKARALVRALERAEKAGLRG